MYLSYTRHPLEDTCVGLTLCSDRALMALPFCIQIGAVSAQICSPCTFSVSTERCDSSILCSKWLGWLEKAWMLSVIPQRCTMQYLITRMFVGVCHEIEVPVSIGSGIRMQNTFVRDLKCALRYYASIEKFQWFTIRQFKINKMAYLHTDPSCN